MQSFSFLEEAGLRLAAMSDKSTGDCGGRESARENTRRFLSVPGQPDREPVRVHQVHGTRVVRADEARSGVVEADGLCTDETGVLLSMSVADCAPVLLFDPVCRAIGLLHAGREGTFHNIALAGVQAMKEHFSSSPASLLALVGPCAHVCCYEVSAELAGLWRDAGYPARDRNLDIPSANRLQLENAGVFRHNIHIVPHCTVCGGVFFSYRTDKTSKRNLVVMML
ncbi:MAG: laccase domain-containing protein [Candidatus Hydrogenedens sp.]|nr:laccase domain-containing protein [Candidatus Hydrogenedens sp.]